MNAAPRMAAPAAPTSFYRRDRETNFGRTEIIDGSQYTSLIDVDIPDQLPWTIIIDTQELTFSSAPSMPAGTFSSKVQAKIEVGSGNGITTSVIDATDLVIFPVSGDHVRVSVTLVSALNLLPFEGASLFFGSGLPGPAPKGDQARVSAFLSSGIIFPPPSLGAAGTLPLITGAGPANLALVAVPNPLPCRLLGFTAVNPSGSPLFLALKSTNNFGEALPLAQALATTLAIIPLPPMTPVQIQYPQTLAFPRGMGWESCSTADGQTQSATAIRVDPVFLRVPQQDGAGGVLGVSSISSIG